MIEYSAIAGTIGAKASAIWRWCTATSASTTTSLIATIITLIATIQLIQFSVTVWSTNFLRHAGSLHDNKNNLSYVKARRWPWLAALVMIVAPQPSLLRCVAGRGRSQQVVFGST